MASVVFRPDEQNTAKGLLAASAVTILPYTLLGPFVGVFIDRWPRRKILAIAPLLKIAFVPLVLFDPLAWPVKIFFYFGVLAVLSINRFQLAAASAVVPRLVPADDLLLANSIATVGGTLALLIGVFVGGRIDDIVGSASVILIATLAWLVRLADREPDRLRPRADDPAGSCPSCSAMRSSVSRSRRGTAPPRCSARRTRSGPSRRSRSTRWARGSCSPSRSSCSASSSARASRRSRT